MDGTAAWGDVENAVAVWLRSHLDGVRVCNELPAALETSLPLVQVQVLPGGGDDQVTDTVLVDVDTFAATRAAMWQLATQVRSVMLQAAGQAPAAVPLDTVDTESRPAPVDYGNPAVRRAVATYRLTYRARATA